jgi:ATP-dependent DNA helicase DinG
MIENPLQFFPLEKARGLQSAVIDEIDKVFRSGKKIVILEAPVGSGKSAVALTLGRAAKDCHILTPRKSLQDQYFDDFEEHIVLMKGRNSYPCTFDSTPNEYRKVINKIKGGQIAAPSINEETCATGPCRDSKSMFDKCVGLNGPCPYKVAMEVAQNNDIVVHNLHSFIFQTNFTEAFIPRELLIVDEAHEIEGIMRDFISKSFTSHKPVWTSRVPESSDPEDWREVLFSDDFVPIETASDRIKKQQDPDFTSERDNYLLKVKIFLDQLESTGHKYTIKFHENNHGRTGVHVVKCC